MPRVLVVDDDKAIRDSLNEILSERGYEVDEAVDGLDCTAKIKKGKQYDVVLLDVSMPKLDGFETLDRVLNLAPDTAVIMMTALSEIEGAVKAVRNGAFDYLPKPLDLKKLNFTINNALNKRAITPTGGNTSRRRTTRPAGGNRKIQEIIGESPAIMHVKRMIDIVAPNEYSRVLVLGPNGAGKELVAQWIHAKSPRNDKPYVEVNCAAIPKDLIESELFGHKKGAFTGADKDRVGKFKMADGGTLFLDEIGDMSWDAQTKVLRALEQGTITPVGSEKSMQVNVRVIAATNKDLMEAVKKGTFREDLYFRLNVIPITVPPLKKRLEDIPLLVEHFLKLHHSKTPTLPLKTMSDDAMKALMRYEWPGNVRQLRNVVERLMILSAGDEITAKDVEMYLPDMGF